MPIHEDRDLERVVHDDPSNPDAWMVYADALLGAGDPRGHIIAMGVRGETEDLPRLVEIYEEVWGDAKPVAEGVAFDELTWTGGWQGATPEPIEARVELVMSRFGLVDTITVHGLDEDGQVARALESVLECPMGRFTRLVRLELDETFYGASGQPNYDAVLALMTRARPEGLRCLEMAAGVYQLSWTNSGNLGPLLRAAPRLEELSVELGRISFGTRDLDLPKLRSLVLQSGGLPSQCVQAIGAASWPSLETLTVYLGCPEYGGDTEPAQLDGILRRPEAFPVLTQLGLCNAEIQGSIVHLIASSPLLPRLRRLDLSKGTLTDEELGPILDKPRAFAHLEVLDITESYLSDDAVHVLCNALRGVNVQTGGQRHHEMIRDRNQHGTPEWAKTGFRYTVVGE